MGKPTYNEKGEATNCFAYSPKQVKKAECTILKKHTWYNERIPRCKGCTFFKTVNEVAG